MNAHRASSRNKLHRSSEQHVVPMSGAIGSVALAVALACAIAPPAAAATFSDKADVTRARKVTPPAVERRCWTEWEQNAAGTMTPAAAVVSQPSGWGAFKFVAASGGAAAAVAYPTSAESAAMTGSQAAAKPVEHCIEEPGAAKPAYWEVEYTYRGIPFSTRLDYDPGSQLTVRVVVDPQP